MQSTTAYLEVAAAAAVVAAAVAAAVAVAAVVAAAVAAARQGNAPRLENPDLRAPRGSILTAANILTHRPWVVMVEQYSHSGRRIVVGVLRSSFFQFPPSDQVKLD
jgi:hypothetical protein